jgi:hypothetical protein
MYRLPLSGPGVIRESDGNRIVEGSGADWATYQAWLAAENTPDPPAPILPPPIVVSYDQWLALFTLAEREWAFSSNDAAVKEAISRGASAQLINLSSPNVAGFLDLCISLGSPLTVERKAEVLAGNPPA